MNAIDLSRTVMSIVIIIIPLNYFFFFRFIVQLLSACFVIDVIAFERAYWWKILIWIELSRYCYACYCWCVTTNINIYIALLKTKQLSNLSKVATLPTCNRKVVNSNLGWYSRYHNWSTLSFYSSCPCSCLDGIPDCPTVRPSTSCPITANYSPFYSTPIFRSGGSDLHYTVYRDKVIALTIQCIDDRQHVLTRQGPTQRKGRLPGHRPQNTAKPKFKKYRLCRYYDIKSFTWFTL
jgi:hypothetical protein